MPHGERTTELFLAAKRNRSKWSRLRMFAKRNPVVVWALLASLGTISAWACSYAPPSGVGAALCQLRSMLAENLRSLLVRPHP